MKPPLCEQAYATQLIVGGRQYDAQIPVIRVEPVRIDAQRAVMDMAKISGWNHGSFATTFGDLDSETKEYQDVFLQDLSRILSAAARRTPETMIDLYFVKVPGEVTTNWGLLILVVVQGYFLLQLKQLAQRLTVADPGREISWIGIYPSAASKVTFAISAFLLPVAATIGLGVKGLQVSSHSPSSWLLLVGTSLQASRFLSLPSPKHSASNWMNDNGFVNDSVLYHTLTEQATRLWGEVAFRRYLRQECNNAICCTHGPARKGSLEARLRLRAITY